MGTTREELMPHMKRVAAANAQIVIDLCANASWPLFCLARSFFRKIRWVENFREKLVKDFFLRRFLFRCTAKFSLNKFTNSQVFRLETGKFQNGDPLSCAGLCRREHAPPTRVLGLRITRSWVGKPGRLSGNKTIILIFILNELNFVKHF